MNVSACVQTPAVVCIHVNVQAFLCENTYTSQTLFACVCVCVCLCVCTRALKRTDHTEGTLIIQVFSCLCLMKCELRLDGWLVAQPGFQQKGCSLSTDQTPLGGIPDPIACNSLDTQCGSSCFHSTDGGCTFPFLKLQWETALAERAVLESCFLGVVDISKLHANANICHTYQSVNHLFKVYQSNE